MGQYRFYALKLLINKSCDYSSNKSRFYMKRFTLEHRYNMDMKSGLKVKLPPMVRVHPRTGHEGPKEE
jgi:hypothetical protein